MKERINMQSVIDNIRKNVATHRIESGLYARWIWQNDENNRDLGPNPYGCADAANILYSIGDFPKDIDERSNFVRNLRAMQDKKTGFFFEETHHPIHTTAHCMAALELFDATPETRAFELEKYMSSEKLDEFLTALDWEKKPWSQAHLGAGIFAALNLGGSDTKQFNKYYFNWLYEHSNPESGMWELRRDGTANDGSYMAASFHYLFNVECYHQPLRYPDKLIDSCIKMYHEKKWPMDDSFGKQLGFTEVDWVYCLNRARRQTPHRFDEVTEILSKFAEDYADYLLNLDFEKDDKANDLHSLFGCTCAIAEIQQALNGIYETDKPLKLVLDRRPFI